MRAYYYPDEDINVVLRLLTYENMLVCAVSLETGLRVSDVLGIRAEQIKQKSFTVTERKTGKKRKVRLSPELLQALREITGSVYVFEHRTDCNKTRTRQAVYTDLKRAQKALRLTGSLSPHSMRKNYAVALLRKTGDIQQVKKSLNHTHIEDTLLYALSDEIARHSLPKRAVHR